MSRRRYKGPSEGDDPSDEITKAQARMSKYLRTLDAYGSDPNLSAADKLFLIGHLRTQNKTGGHCYARNDILAAWMSNKDPKAAQRARSRLKDDGILTEVDNKGFRTKRTYINPDHSDGQVRRYNQLKSGGKSDPGNFAHDNLTQSNEPPSTGQICPLTGLK